MIKKILIVAFIIVALSWGFTKFKPSKPDKSSFSSNILGVSTNAFNKVSKSAPGKSIENIAHNLIDTTSHVASNIASSAATTVTDFAFDVATKPVIEKINSLPPDKKSEIKDALCK